MRNMTLLPVLVGLMLPESVFAMGCPYVIEVLNKQHSTANLIEIKSRISGKTWKVVEDFKDQGGEMLKGDMKWSEDYRTDAHCNTTKHDFLLKFRNAQNLTDIKLFKKVKVNNGEIITFTLGK